MKRGSIIGLAAIAVLVIYLISAYNGLVGGREDVDAQWANVENQYQRRADLIPNLVATVQGYASHESSVFTAVAEARKGLGGNMTVDSSITEDEEAFNAFVESQNKLSAGLGRLLALQENYPELKANENFLELQSQLEGTENRIATERTRYNEKAQAYNKKRQVFPTVLIANIFGFKAKQYFKTAQENYNAPVVNFSN